MASWLANFGKSIGYSAKDVLTEVAPNTTKITEDAADEIYKLRDFMSDYRAKGKQVDRALNFTELQKQANDIIEGTINDIKTGNFATPKDDFGDLFGSDDLDFDSSDYTTSEDQNESGVEVRKLNLSTDAKATAKVSLEGSNRIAETLERSSKAQMMAQVNTAKAIMNTTNNIGMIAVNKLGASLTETNKRLDQINTNLVNIVKFMNENQSKVNQAHLDYLKSAHAFMKVQMEMYRPSKKKGKTPAMDAFLAGGSFDLPSYISVVKENYQNSSSLSELQMMLGMGSMMGNLMGGMGGPKSMIRPTQMLMNAAMKKLIPKKIQKAITKVDDLLPQALMGGLSTLSDMRNESGIKGMLGQLLGAGARKQDSFQLGKYYKGAVPWDGKSKRALEVVIPHYLAMIEANTSNIPKRRGSKDPVFYDYDTGTFKDKKQIREGLRARTSDAFRGASAESNSFFESKFQDDEALQDEAKKIMWKHLQPMIYGERLLEGEKNLTQAARAYGKELEKLGLNPFEISQLVIYFKGTVTKLRQYMMQMELTESESELFNRRETNQFGFIKGGFGPEDLGTSYTATDLSRKQERDKKKAEEAAEETKRLMDRAKGTVFASNKQKNRYIQNIKYAASEGVGTTYTRNKAASKVEAAGLGLIGLISGYDTIDTTGGVLGVANSFKKNVIKYEYDHLTVADVMNIMRNNAYNPDQYDFITADNSGDKDGLFGLAVLKYRYGKPGCLRVVKRRNIVLDGKKYIIKPIDHDDRVVRGNDRDSNLQPPGGSDIYPMGKQGIPRDGNTQWQNDQAILNDKGEIKKKPKDSRTFRQKVRDKATQVMTGKDPNAPSDNTNNDNGALGNGERLGGAPARRVNTQNARRPGANTNEASRRRSEDRNRGKDTRASINIAIDELNKSAEAVEDVFTDGKEIAANLWQKIKAKVGFTKRTAMRAGIGGVLGSLFIPGGPIGGAILGATVGIATTGFDFKRLFFGSKTVDENGVVHVEKTGMVGQWTNMLQTEGKNLLKSSFDSVKNEVASYAKAQFAPIVAAFRDMGLKNPVTKTMVETIQNVGKNVISIITNPMQALNNGIVKITGAMLGATVKGGAFALKTAAKAATWIAAKPTQLIADLWNSRNAENPLEFLKNLRGQRRARRNARWGARADYVTHGLLGNLKDSAKSAVTKKGGIRARIGAFKSSMAHGAESYYGAQYQDEKDRLNDIQSRMQSVDPMERQSAMEELLPKDRNGNVKDKAWNALPRDENGQIDPNALNEYIGKNYQKFINNKEQALAGLTGFSKYRAEKQNSKRQNRLDKVFSKYNRKDAYAAKDLTDKEYAKRRKDVEQYLERDAEGNIIDETYNRIENKEDFDKWMKNQEAFKKELQERDRIAAEKAEEEKEKAAAQVTRKNQIALALGQISATLGIPLDESLIDTASDKASAIINAVNAAIEQKKQKMQDQAEEEQEAEEAKQKEEENKAEIAETEHRRKTAAANEDKADAADAQRRAREAEETASIQAQGKDKVKDSTGEEDEEPGKAEPVEGNAVAQEEEEEGGIGDILKKAGLAIGGITTVAALLNSEAGKKLISTLGSVIGGALKSIGGSIIDWVKGGLGDLAGGIADNIKGFLGMKSEATTKEMTKEDLADLNPDYVSDGTVTYDEEGNEIVNVTTNSDQKNILGNTARRAVTQAAAAGLSPKYAKAAGTMADFGVHTAKTAGNFIMDHKGAVLKGAKTVGKGALKVADVVTDFIPGMKTVKKVVKGGAWVGKQAGKGANWLTKAFSGKSIGENAKNLLTTVKQKAPEVASAAIDKGKDLAAKARTNLTKAATAVADSKTGQTVMKKLQTIIDGINDILKKFMECKQLQSLLKKIKSSELVNTMKKSIEKVTSKLTNVVKSGDKSFNKVISEAVQNFMGSTAGQVLKTATVVVSGVWSAATGALDAANLFMVNDDDVDVGMRTVSAIMNLLVDFIPVAGPAFDFLSTVSEMLGFRNFKRDLAENVYNLLFSITGGNSRGVQTLDQKQQEFEKEYEAYLKDHKLSKEDLSIAEYNDIVNQTVGDKVVNTVSGAAKTVGNWISGLFGGNKDKKEEETSQGNGPGSEKPKSKSKAEIKKYHENLKNNKKAAAKKSEKFNSLGNGGGALGYGPGGLKQDDPSYASLSLGTLPDGSPANMANSGCGPTALANAVNAAGGNANPGEVGRYARRNGMLTDGGANAKLFTEGARKYGMSGTEISGMDSLDASLDNGNPVIVSGKSMGYGSGCNSCDSLYTKAGHIVTVTGRTPDGMYTVDDGEGSSVVSPGMLQNGATHAYSMERLGGAITRGTSASDGTAVRASNTGTQANVMQDNGTTIQHGSYYFAQNDPTWGGNTLSGYSSSIKNTGCVMTSAAMGASTVLGKPIDPGTFNAQYGNGNVGSTSFNNLGLKVTRLPAGGRQAIVSPSGNILPQVVQALKQRKMVMMYGDKSATNMYNDGNPNGSAHCVLATGLDSAGNILINNPWSSDGKYGQVRYAQVAYPAVPSSVDPFHWAQIIETTDGKGASTTLDPSAVSGVAAGSAAGSTASGATAGAAGTTGTTADGTATGTDSTSGSSGNVLEAIFGAMGNIVNTVGGRLMKSVFSGKSYDEVKAEEEAQEAQAAATGTDATSLGSGPASANLTPKEQAEALKARGKQTDAMLKKKLSKAQLEKINFGPTEDIGHGPAMGDETTISDSGDKLDQMILLLTDIRDNTGNMVSGGALGGTTKKMETGKNTNASKEGKKSDTQRKQRAKDSAKQKLSTLNNGLNSDSLGRGNLRSTYAKIASY